MNLCVHECQHTNIGAHASRDVCAQASYRDERPVDDPAAWCPHTQAHAVRDRGAAPIITSPQQANVELCIDGRTDSNARIRLALDMGLAVAIEA